MPHILRTIPAEGDQIEIWKHIASDNFDAADRLLRRFEAKLQLLSENPGLGPARPEFAPNVRSFPVGNYILFYRVIVDGIELLRVLHGARDIEQIFG